MARRRLAHELEAWGDQQTLDSTIAFQQPLIAPLYGGVSAIEILAKLAGEKSTNGHDLVRKTQEDDLDTYAKGLIVVGFPADVTSADQLWRGALHLGFYRQARGNVLELGVDSIVNAVASAAAPSHSATMKSK